MPTFSLLQVSYTRSPVDLRDEQLIKVWFDKIVNTNYYLYSDKEYSQLNRWEDIYKHHLIPASISPQALQEMTGYCQNTGDHLSFYAIYLLEAFTFSLGIVPEDKTVYLIVHSNEIADFPDSLRNYKLFIEQVELLYQYWHPYYSFLWVDDGNPILPHEDALAGKIPGLYEINIFGPELVAQFGRERLLTAPAWHVKEFDDGGIILVISPYQTEDPDFPETGLETYERVAEHVGLPFLQY